MQETKTRTPAEEVPSSRPPWIRAVAIVAAVVLLGGVLYGTWQAVAGNDDPEADPIGLGESEPDFSLTDEQATSTFLRLSARARAAVESRDITLLPTTFTSSGPMHVRTKETIDRLRNDGVFDKSDFESESVEVISNRAHEIEIHERVLVDPCYESDAGKDITKGPASFEYGAHWILRLEDARWLIHESVVVGDEEVVDSNEGSC